MKTPREWAIRIHGKDVGDDCRVTTESDVRLIRSELLDAVEAVIRLTYAYNNSLTARQKAGAMIAGAEVAALRAQLEQKHLGPEETTRIEPLHLDANLGDTPF